jgi:predicted enzyme related to lactoylglutathione lyase
MSGKIVHFEIPFDDGERARNFYREAFGWQVNEIPDLQYTMVSTGPGNEEGFPSEPGFINGGMGSRESGSLKSPTVVVEVESIDAALEKIEKLGGAKAVGRTQVADMGFSAYFTDPEGNLIGLWENAPQG